MLFDPPTNNTDHVPPTALATLAPAQAQVSGLHVLVIVLAAVLVTALLSCVLGHSKMGARLWSHRRSARATHTTPASHHTHTTIITPTSLSHSVLYVCEGMNNSMGDAMAAAARDRNTRYQSVQQDTTLGFPYQVQRPDGEERYPSKKPLPAPDQEIYREYIKPPANKTLSDVNVNGPHHSCSVGGFPAQPECGLGHSGIPSYRYSAPLEAQSPHSAVSASSSSSSSSSSLSSSFQTWGGSRDEGQTSRSSRNALARNCFAPFTSSRFDRSPQTFHQESNRRRNRHQGHLGTNSPSPSHDQNIPTPYCRTTNTLAEIKMLSVPCGPSTHSSSHEEGPSESQGINVGSLGVQGDLSHTYGQSSEFPCSPTAEPQHPPLCSDVIENNSLYRSASRPSEQRTKSGKI